LKAGIQIVFRIGIARSLISRSSCHVKHGEKEKNIFMHDVSPCRKKNKTSKDQLCVTLETRTFSLSNIHPESCSVSSEEQIENLKYLPQMPIGNIFILRGFFRARYPSNEGYGI
jgi:hypothetical protein